MVKTTLILTFSALTLYANEPSSSLQNNCLSCHSKQKIPSEFIYRRYLLTYSAKETIKAKLFSYLQAPKKEHSIMPKQFFLKFPEKKASNLNATKLKESIQEYMEYFEIKKKLVLPE